MSGGMAFCGLRQKDYKDDIKTENLQKCVSPLFELTGKIELESSFFQPLYIREDVENLEQFQIIQQFLESKYGFDAVIDIEGCDIASEISREMKNDRASLKIQEYKKTWSIEYEFCPVGMFYLPREMRKIKESVKEELQKLESIEDAWAFLEKYGSHFPAPENMYHYGGVKLNHHLPKRTENKYHLEKNKRKENFTLCRSKKIVYCKSKLRKRKPENSGRRT